MSSGPWLWPLTFLKAIEMWLFGCFRFRHEIISLGKRGEGGGWTLRVTYI